MSNALSKLIERIAAPREHSQEWSNLLGVALVVLFGGLNLVAYLDGYWSAEFLVATATYALLGMIMLMPDVELWELGEDAFDE